MLLRRLTMTETLAWHANEAFRTTLRAELEGFAGRGLIEVLSCGGDTLATWRPRANRAAMDLLTARLSGADFGRLFRAAAERGETIAEYVGRLAASRPDTTHWLEGVR